MTFFINMNYTGWFAALAESRGGFGVIRKGQRAMLTESNRKTVSWWHRKFIPRHFEPSARYRYHYQLRKQPYASIKLALAAGRKVYVNGKLLPPEKIQKAGRVNIVRSGTTERKAEQPTTIYAGENRATITMRVPSHIVARRSKLNQGREIQKLTAAEEAQLVRIWKKTFLASFRVFGSSITAVRRRIRRT